MIAKPHQILLIDQDPDEHFLIEMALTNSPLSIKCTYCPDSRQAIASMRNKDVSAPDFVLFAIPYPTRLEDLLMTELKTALQGTNTEILVYGLDQRPFFHFLERHNCRFLQKCFSLDQLRQSLVDLFINPSALPAPEQNQTGLKNAMDDEAIFSNN